GCVSGMTIINLGHRDAVLWARGQPFARMRRATLGCRCNVPEWERAQLAGHAGAERAEAAVVGRLRLRRRASSASGSRQPSASQGGVRKLIAGLLDLMSDRA